MKLSKLALIYSKRACVSKAAELNKEAVGLYSINSSMIVVIKGAHDPATTAQPCSPPSGNEGGVGALVTSLSPSSLSCSALVASTSISFFSPVLSTETLDRMLTGIDAIVRSSASRLVRRSEHNWGDGRKAADTG